MVDKFIDLLLVNDVLNANAAIKAVMSHMLAGGLKYHITALACREAVVHVKYTGRTMKESHTHLDIDEKEWQARWTSAKRE